MDGKAAIEETVKTLTLLRDGISKALEWYKDKTINNNNKNYLETFTTNDGRAVKTVQVASSSDAFGKYIYPPELPTVDNNGQDKDMYSDTNTHSENLHSQLLPESDGKESDETSERKRKAGNQGKHSKTKRQRGDDENSTAENEGQQQISLRISNRP
jgi:hypothetical protein